jgi:prepilin-type N-terminal cleavage/methylation domain-containing protein
MRHANLPHLPAASHRSHVSHGFTLVELLVVMAIISVLMGLLLPAVQSCRESARRCKCQNNVAQLGLALHHYECAHEAFPAGVTGDAGPIRNLPEGKHVGWILEVLPFMEERVLASHFSRGDGVYAESNRQVRASTNRMMICPSSPIDAPRREDGGSPVAVSSYAGCHHDIEAPIDADNHGMLFLDSRIRFVDILDGSSRTLLIAERRGSQKDLGWASGTRATLRNASPFRERTPYTVGDDPAPENPLVVGGFGSDHAGGIVVAGLADGAVRSLHHDISPDVLRQLGHRADGELPVRDGDSRYDSY